MQWAFSWICCVIRIYYLFTVQNKNFQIQNTIQYNLMQRKAFSQNLSHQNKPWFWNEIKMFKTARFLEVQEALQISIFILRILLMKSFLTFELWIRLNQSYSKFSCKSEITRKSRKPSVSGKRRFCRTSKLPVFRRVCDWLRLVWTRGAGGGGELIYFIGGYVCRMAQNCDP